MQKFSNNLLGVRLDPSATKSACICPVFSRSRTGPATLALIVAKLLRCADTTHLYLCASSCNTGLMDCIWFWTILPNSQCWSRHGTSWQCGAWLHENINSNSSALRPSLCCSTAPFLPLSPTSRCTLVRASALTVRP